jgi:two-component system chemotaxis response regulator CheB
VTNATSRSQTVDGVALPEWRHSMTADGHDIIVIGASAGGVEALCAVLAALSPDLPAAVFAVMHIPAWRPSALPAILSRCSPLHAVHPESGDPIQRGHIYLAPPDRHLLIDSENHVQLWHGPKENGCRPSINALFRSAAVTFGARVTGVILTGSLDDGTTGLWWIKRMGGAVVIQDPTEAEFASMPQNALSHVPADYVAKLAEIGPILTELARPVSSRRSERSEGRVT